MSKFYLATKEDVDNLDTRFSETTSAVMTAINTIDGKTETAQSTANTAVTKADNAQTTADNAQTTANNAIPKASFVFDPETGTLDITL